MVDQLFNGKASTLGALGMTPDVEQSVAAARPPSLEEVRRRMVAYIESRPGRLLKAVGDLDAYINR
jgi:hypothetical protein